MMMAIFERKNFKIISWSFESIYSGLGDNSAPTRRYQANIYLKAMMVPMVFVQILTTHVTIK